MKNYRKAKKGEIVCWYCKWSVIREWSGRLSCIIGNQLVVSRKGTCDYAALRASLKGNYEPTLNRRFTS